MSELRIFFGVTCKDYGIWSQMILTQVCINQWKEDE